MGYIIRKTVKRPTRYNPRQARLYKLQGVASCEVYRRSHMGAVIFARKNVPPMYVKDYLQGYTQALAQKGLRLVLSQPRRRRSRILRR